MPAFAAHVPRVARLLDIPLRLDDGRGVAVTFDDGPHPEGTPAVLDVLRRRQARATFFLIGEQVRRRPELARRIVEDGHEVALHGDRHTLLLRHRVRAVAHDWDLVQEAVAEATGVRPTLYRPPYGAFSAGALDELRRRGWRAQLWSRWGRDWRSRRSPASIARLATAALRPGDVVLLHDSDAYGSSGSWRSTVAALPAVLDAIAALGVPAVSISRPT